MPRLRRTPAGLAAACWLALLGPASATAQEGPRFPGSVTEAPAWLGRDLPFDVGEFLRVPPPEQDAATRYLEALFEFHPDMLWCFPLDEQSARQAGVARARHRRTAPILAMARRDPGAVPAPVLAAVLAEHETGLRGIAEAQRRPARVFRVGLGQGHLPHRGAIGHAGGILALRSRLEADRGAYREALRDLAMLLRMVRDLRPRASFRTQEIAQDLEELALTQIVPRLLAGADLDAASCEELLRTLRTHDEAPYDGFVTGLRAEYLDLRWTLHSARDYARNTPGAGWPPGQFLTPTIAPLGPSPFEQLLRVTRRRERELVPLLNGWFGELLALADRPHAERRAGAARVLRSIPRDDEACEVILALLPDLPAALDREARLRTDRRAAIGLAAVRLWQIRQSRPPHDLEEALSAAGMAPVLQDGYSSGPLRLSIMDGVPAILSDEPAEDGTAMVERAHRLPPVDSGRGPRPVTDPDER